MWYVVILKMNKIVHCILITKLKREFNIIKLNRVIIMKSHLLKLLSMKHLQI